MPDVRRLLARSVRARVTVGAVAVVATTLLALGLGTVSLVRERMVETVSLTARAQAHTVATLAEAGQLPALLEVDDLEDTLLQVVAVDGTVRAASPQLTGLGPLMGTAPDETGESDRTLRVELPDGSGVFRVVALPTSTPTGAVVVYAASSLRDTDDALGALAEVMAVGLGIALLVIAGVTYVVVRQALRPVESIRTQVDRISATDLTRRVPVPASGDEVARLAATMNRMLDRLSAAAERQRRFVADVSHEIRSPIASLRTQIEVAQTHPELTDWPEFVDDLAADTERLEALASDLLLLARLDADTGMSRSGRDTAVDLGELVAGLLARRPSGRVDVVAVLDPTVVVLGNPMRLERMVGNLLDNAWRHARSRVEVSIARSAASALLRVCNDGVAIPGEDRERIFDRFVRLDDARSRDSGGTGLGLPIAREIARAMGGDIEVADPPSPVCFVVSLPLAAAEG